MAGPGDHGNEGIRSGGTVATRAAAGDSREARREPGPERAREGRGAGPLERAGEVGHHVGHALHDAVLSSDGTRRVADVLHGTWLGHPLHPVLTDVTIGAWTFGALFDVLATATGSRENEHAADTLTAMGLASSVPTVLAGLADYSTLPKRSAKTATTHALLNGASIALYALSLRDRRRGRRRRGVAFSMAALGANAVSAWLGGHLVYRERVGVDRAERFRGPDEWTVVADLEDVPDGSTKRVEVDDGDVMLYRDGRQVYAIGAVCSHASGPLEEGEIRGCFVQCPWHDSVFDMRDGSVEHGPATAPVASFETRVRGERIELRLAGG